MVTFLDVGLLNYFSIIFPVLLIFAIVYAVFKQTKILGEENNTLIAVISIVIALMTLLVRDVLEIIKFISPWFVLVFIFLVLLLTIYKLFGATEENLFNALKGEKAIQWSILGVGIIILLAGIANVFGQKIGPYLGGEKNATEVATSSFQQNVFATLFHPKILGVLMVLAIAVFAIAFLTGKES